MSASNRWWVQTVFLELEGHGVLVTCCCIGADSTLNPVETQWLEVRVLIVLGKTLYSHSASLHPGVNGCSGELLEWEGGGSGNTPCVRHCLLFHAVPCKNVNIIYTFYSRFSVWFAVKRTLPLPLDKVFYWSLTTFWHHFDNFLMVSLYTSKSNRKNCETRRCQLSKIQRGAWQLRFS